MSHTLTSPFKLEQHVNQPIAAAKLTLTSLTQTGSQIGVANERSGPNWYVR